ncbi:MAG: RES family NAD+ phosphorylase [Pseudomonadota bacterium]
MDRISDLPLEPFNGIVYRTTRTGLDPLAYSTRGGRWARPNGTAVLYTSLERSGALAELSYHWGRLTPLPTKAMVLHRVQVSLRQVRRLPRDRLADFGLTPDIYRHTNVTACQEIGEAAAFLGADALLAPSARWACDNLVVFGDDARRTDVRLIDSEEVDWKPWAEEQGFLQH